MGPRRGLAKKRVGAERTPEGKPICFRYNAPNGCKNGAKCHFAHVCSLCFQNRYWKALHLSPSSRTLKPRTAEPGSGAFWS